MKKTVLITGCSSGFGAATARHYAAHGWNVIATMRNLEAGAELRRQDGVMVVRLDVQDPESIAHAVAAGLDRFGRIDVLVNNAGFGLFGVFEGTPRDKILEQFEVNILGVMDVTRALLPHFRANRAGTIVNISSGAGVFGLPMISLYTATKFALEGWSESLSYELSALGIVVKIVEPGGVLGTNFGLRSAAEASGAIAPRDYDTFITGSSAVFNNLSAQALETPEHVANVIYRASTDGTARLRYVATNDIETLARARRETSEDAYMAMMRVRFGVPVGGSHA